jgi:hypothetical protein
MPSSALASQFRYPLAGTEGGYQGDPGAARPQETGDHGAVCSGGHRCPAGGNQSDRDLAAPIREKTHGTACARGG